MCSSGGKVAVDDQALQDATLASVKQQTADYGTTFAEQQQVLNSVKTRMQAEATNPLGYTPAQLAIQRTGINENFANAAKQALGSAAAFGAAHGSADIGGGATGQIAGEIGGAAATGAAQARASLAQQNEALKQENKWKALSGLDTVGAQYGGAAGTAIGSVSGVADASTQAGSGVLAAKQAGWDQLSGVLSGISGLATAASGFKGLGCWVAAAIYGGWDEPRTVLVRSYIFGEFSTTWYGSLLARIYIKIGERIAKIPFLVRALTPLFNLALRKAQEK